MSWGKPSPQKPSTGKRLYQSGHPDCRCLTRHAVSPPPPQMQRFRERQNRLADGGLPDIWRNIGTRCTQNFTANASHRPIRPSALQLHVSFENEATNRLVYLFTLDLDDDSILCNKNFKGGKLWTFQQMEHNLGRNFFSSCLEYEFEHLEAIIYTREKYKES